MSGPSRSWLRLVVVAALTAYAAGQQCYYPNGRTAPDTEKPCSSAEGSACCPDLWQCLDNGLCHYPKENLYGRYSCTDQTWNSPGCPSNMCTYDMSAAGGESITQCSNHDNNWCCNADNIHVKCCQESPAPRPFFALQDGRAYATIGGSIASAAPTLNTITGLVSGTGSGTSAPRTSAPTTSAASSSTPATSASPSRVITSLQTSVTSGSAGVETLTITNVITQGPDPTADTSSQSGGGGGSSNIGLIVGCAVGIPLALALVGIVLWMLRKRRQQKANPYKETAELDHPDSPSFAGGIAAKLGKNTNQSTTYRHSRPGTAEIDGQPVGPGRPISTVKGRAELPSGTEFQPSHGVPFAPDTVGLGGGSGNPDRSTWGSVPPQYSPAANQSTFSQYADVSELDGTSVGMAPIQEKAEGGHGQTQNPQEYQAYRPPPAELPTVKTPPEDVEKQISQK
ncbi:hypothetical protein IQ07DRAFT_584720 [Pyrenochaeta sp. DS3sAY3a]|nr:hypothetical protein IQ07DRAFT_584720 [Pyrenochaeta sp. DS3sAY3a]